MSSPRAQSPSLGVDREPEAQAARSPSPASDHDDTSQPGNDGDNADDDTNNTNNDNEYDNGNTNNDNEYDNGNDDLDDLDEIDENQFDDYDPATANIEDRPVTIDDDVARTLKAARRKRTDLQDSRKPREAARRRPTAGAIAGPDSDEEGANASAKKRRTSKTTSSNVSDDPSSSEQQQQQDTSHLTPEERRRRALEQALDAAAKGPSKKRRRGGGDEGDIDLTDPIEEQVKQLADAMARACRTDNEDRDHGKPAMAKISLLPDVMSMINRQAAQECILDPDSGFLRAMRFFLEPLNDGNLPAYNVQRDLFEALTRLPITKEGLLSSGLGKVVYFYTLSTKTEASVKRSADKLIADWSRSVLRRTDDYRKRNLEQRSYDPAAAKIAHQQQALANSSQSSQSSSQFSGSQPSSSSQSNALRLAAAERDRALAMPSHSRFRTIEMPQSYTIAPRSTLDPTQAAKSRSTTGSMDKFRRLTAKSKRK